MQKLWVCVLEYCNIAIVTSVYVFRNLFVCMSCVKIVVSVYTGRWLRNVKELICKVLYLNKGERVNEFLFFI